MCPPIPLKDSNCRNAKPQDKPYRLYDEQGLHLEVQPKGGRYWRLKYRFQGKEKRLALGVYPEVGLQEARRKQNDARVRLASGQDPSLQRRMTPSQAKPSQQSGMCRLECSHHPKF
ncbi:Arm DNA-binding domain-containing protein [Pseudomonas protegens]|uniref:Arm DNA-binding domain-containing protein n=1 Tax=Pseudomonas protegens TaxID=380021 RepID=UPI00380781F9